MMKKDIFMSPVFRRNIKCCVRFRTNIFPQKVNYCLTWVHCGLVSQLPVLFSFSILWCRVTIFAFLNLPFSLPTSYLSWTQKGILTWNPFFSPKEAQWIIAANLLSSWELPNPPVYTYIVKKLAPHPLGKSVLLSLPYRKVFRCSVLLLLNCQQEIKSYNSAAVTAT